MLAGLRLDGFVGGNHQQDKIDSAHPGQHVAHKTLVAGDIDKAQPQNLAAGQWQFQMRETDIDGDAAALFFFQAIGIDAGKGLYQRGLSVIDVPGGADDDGLHPGQYSRRT